MAKGFKYDENGDLVFENGHIATAEGLDELTQAIGALLTTPYGSFLDEDEMGMNFNFALGNFDQREAVNSARKAIMQDKRVIEIKELKVEPDYDAGIVTIKISAATTLGDIDYGKEVPISATD